MKCPVHPDLDLSLIHSEGSNFHLDIHFRCPEGCEWMTRTRWTDLLPGNRKLPDAEYEKEYAESLKTDPKLGAYEVDSL